MIRYVRTHYPDMRIVTIDQGLDILGIAKPAGQQRKRNGRCNTNRTMIRNPDTMNDTSMLITGIGVISAAGNNVAETLQSFEQGKRNAGPVTLFPPRSHHLFLK